MMMPGRQLDTVRHQREHPLRVVVLPNRHWRDDELTHVEGAGPDPRRLRALLQERGIQMIVRDPLPVPFNPWSRRHPFLAGFDVLRALQVMMLDRSATCIVPVFESGALALLVLRRLLRFKVPIALWDASVGDGWIWRRRVLSVVLPRLDWMFALSRLQKRFVQSHLRDPASAILLGYCVDELFFQPDANEAERLILTVGDDPGRDYSTLLAACAPLDADVILKTGHRFALPTGSAARFQVASGRLSFTELRGLYRKATIFVLPLHQTTHPSGITALFEAMATGKAVIVSNTGVAADFVEDGVTGCLVPAGDAEALRVTIARLLDAPEERLRLGRAARRVIEKEMSMKSFADRFATAVSLIDASRKREPSARSG